MILFVGLSAMSMVARCSEVHLRSTFRVMRNLKSKARIRDSREVKQTPNSSGRGIRGRWQVLRLLKKVRSLISQCFLQVPSLHHIGPCEGICRLNGSELGRQTACVLIITAKSFVRTNSRPTRGHLIDRPRSRCRLVPGGECPISDS